MRSHQRVLSDEHRKRRSNRIERYAPMFGYFCRSVSKKRARVKTPTGRAARSFRPAMESLENRAMLTSLVHTGNAAVAATTRVAAPVTATVIASSMRHSRGADDGVNHDINDDRGGLRGGHGGDLSALWRTRRSDHPQRERQRRRSASRSRRR